MKCGCSRSRIGRPTRLTRRSWQPQERLRCTLRRVRRTSQAPWHPTHPPLPLVGWLERISKTVVPRPSQALRASGQFNLEVCHIESHGGTARLPPFAPISLTTSSSAFSTMGSRNQLYAPSREEEPRQMRVVSVSSLTKGKMRLKAVPTPGTDSTRICPPHDFIISRTPCSPSPVPFVPLVLK